MIVVTSFPEPEIDEIVRKGTNEQLIGPFWSVLLLIIVNLFCFDYFHWNVKKS